MLLIELNSYIIHTHFFYYHFPSGILILPKIIRNKENIYLYITVVTKHNKLIHVFILKYKTKCFLSKGNIVLFK